MNKSIIQVSQLNFTPDFPGLQGVNMMARQFPIEPFLVITEFRMEKPVFGPHPHAGISVLTYMLPDSEGNFINRDSKGDFSIIEPGGVHITQAGSGIHHDEFPQEPGVECHGFQIWINHASKDRFVEPKAMHAKAAEIPIVERQDAKVRVLVGQFEGVNSSNELLTKVALLHIFLAPNARITLPAQEMAFVYGLKGEAQGAEQTIKGQALVNYAQVGDEVTLVAGPGGFEFLFGTGIPLNEPITYGGPFVMTTPEQMAEAKLRYAKGEMGRLA
jgi:quercetin 2,3-dioxygenase